MIAIGWLSTRPPVIFGDFVTDQIEGKKEIDLVLLSTLLVIIFFSKRSFSFVEEIYFRKNCNKN